MTALYRCDGCDGIMSADAARIAVEIVEESVQMTQRTIDDPDEFHDAIMEIKTVSFGFEGSHHFCQMACLSSWAMGRAIDERSTA